MSPELLTDASWALGMGLIGAVVFAFIGLASYTDETATIAPLTLLVVLLGVPPAGVFTFFMAGIVAKHITHAIPTALLGIPGDTLAVPMLRDAQLLRELGVPHIALRKAISGGVIAAFLSVPLAVLFAWALSPFADAIGEAAPWIFVVAAVLIAYTSKGRLAAVLALVPFVLLVVGMQAFVSQTTGGTLTISFFLGIATGPLIADLFLSLAPSGRATLRRRARRRFDLAPDTRTWSGRLPNPLKVLDRKQVAYTSAAAGVSSATFVFSPVAMTVLMGEIVGARIKNGYHRLTTVMSVRNGTTESTYIAETLIPLIALGLPLSPMAAGPAAPLFNAPPVHTVNTETGETHNLHDLMSSGEFLVYGLLGVIIASVIAYPFAMTYAHRAASFVMRRISHEAIIGAFAGLILVICLYEGGLLAVGVTLTVGLVGGLFGKMFNMHSGVQFMGFYVAVLTVPQLLALAA
ncbi:MULTISPECIES: tripartite tricarboxylate transporter permease [unclassified Nocardiopsis]|uniref:tripartite tricarboxylate transporter permease n=1 Tax=unclassified Nocardiopsis TaxID=2649073 RepID=UPI00066B258C|nr:MULTISPECIES: tripartite tricarboxylate transporter permease [unclassified Nocardiopsis]MBQ1079657.1 tripartite tricarboxylate transporter permease [Nocardiopsis sp. B62]